MPMRHAARYHAYGETYMLASAACRKYAPSRDVWRYTTQKRNMTAVMRPRYDDAR